VNPRPPTPSLRTSLPECTWPAVPGPTAAALIAQLYQLEETQWLDGEVLLERQLLQLRQLAAYVHRHSPFWRKQFDRHSIDVGQAWSQARLAKVPLLTRQTLLEQGERIHCSIIPPGHEPMQEIQTSGSTGQIVKVKGTRLNNLMWMALTLRDHFWHRRDFSLSMCVVRALIQPRDDDAAAEREGWGPPVTLAFATGPAYCQNLSLSVSEQAAWLVRRNPYYLLTYPTNLNALLDQFALTGRRPAQLTEVRSVGETMSADLRARCETEFGLNVIDTYSAQEVGVIALQCPVSGLYHVQSESLIVEILDDEGAPCSENEVGRVVITDLHNFATPIIRYEIRDYAEVGGACPCGRGLPTLKRILGRQRNMVTLPDGSRHWPVLGLHSFRGIAPIRQYQGVQRTLDTVEMNLVVDAPLTSEQEESLRSVIRTALGYPFNVLFVYHRTELQKTRGGKFEEFISML